MLCRESEHKFLFRKADYELVECSNCGLAFIANRQIQFDLGRGLVGARVEPLDHGDPRRLAPEGGDDVVAIQDRSPDRDQNPASPPH